MQAWNPWLIKDKEIQEKVQKRAISMTSGLSEKLREVGLASLEESRKREDMIQVVHTEIRRNFFSSVSDPYHFDADPDPHP